MQWRPLGGAPLMSHYLIFVLWIVVVAQAHGHLVI